MNHLVKRITATVAGLLLLSYIGFQVYNSIYKSVTTETAINMTVDNNLSAEAYIIRNEQVLTSDKPGVKVFTALNGSRISNNGIVANVYSGNEAAQAKKDIDEIDKQISALSKIEDQNKIYAADLDILNRQINERFLAILNDVDNDNYIALSESKTELLNLLNENQITVGRVKNFDAKINELKQEKTRLSKLIETPTYIKSNKSGYFISTVDGYESTLDFNKVLTLLPADLTKIEPIAVPANVVGKIVSDYEWYLACTLKYTDTLNLSLGQRVKIKIPLASVNELPVIISAINKDSEKGQAAVIFQCESLNSDLSLLRKYTVQIELSKINGIRISSKAVRFLDGAKGVYVKTGNIVRFRKINILHTGNGFLICKIENSSKALKVYDEVIVEGKNLHDGKIIN